MLSKRLEMCASFVRPGCVVCDVGTDHGLLPCELARRGIVTHAYATDLHEKPLVQARTTVAKYGVQDKVRVFQSDGLCALESVEVDDIIIAGMGGELISEIIGAYDYQKDASKHYILQPMTKVVFLRQWLAQAGFVPLQEQAVFEQHHYTVLLCRYMGEKRELSKIDAVIGGLMLKPTADNRAYLEYEIAKLQKMATELLKSSQHRHEAEDSIHLATQLQQKLEQ